MLRHQDPAAFKPTELTGARDDAGGVETLVALDHHDFGVLSRHPPWTRRWWWRWRRWYRSEIAAHAPRKDEHLIGARAHESLRYIRSRRHGTRDSRLGFPYQFRRVVALHDRKAVVHLAVVGVKV